MLLKEGYTVISGPFNGTELTAAIAAYDGAIAAAHPLQVNNGSTSVRTNGLLNDAPVLAAIFSHEPLLSNAQEIIGRPFKLSAFHARSLRPGAVAEPLHQDVAPGRDGWPLIGFIFMIDAFRPENGATRFLSKSQNLSNVSCDVMGDERNACGAAGAMILFHGSTWHGHGTNSTMHWRRSIQGALIPTSAKSAIDHERSLRPEVWSRLPASARSILAS